MSLAVAPASSPRKKLDIAWRTRRRARHVGAALALAALAFARTGRAAALGDFRVNAITTGDQSAPAIASDLTGAFVAVWVDVQDGSVTSIAGRRYSSAGFGSPLGPEFRVNSYTTGGQYAPSVGRDSTGAFVVAWSAFADGSQKSVQAQRYDAAGAPLGTEFRVNTYTTGSQSGPVVAVSPAGAFVVVWSSATTADTTGGIFLQRYSSAGAPQGGEVRVNTATTGVQQEPHVAMTSTGDFVVVWSSLAAGAGIRGQRYSATGAPAGGEFAIGGASGVSARPAVAADLTGNFVVAWENSPDFADDVFMRRFSSTGAPLTGEIRVNTYTTGIQEDAAVTVFPSGDFVIAWAGGSSEDGAGYGVFAQRYAATGEPVGGEVQVNAFTNNDQSSPALAPGAGGGFLAVWQSTDQDAALSRGVFGHQEFVGAPVDAADFRVNTYTTQDQSGGRVSFDEHGNHVVTWSGLAEDGSGSGVYAQLYDDSGAPIGTEFRVNARTTDNQSSPDVAVLPAGGFVVAWTDVTSGNAEIVARRFDDAGSPVTAEFRVNTTTTSSQVNPRVAASPSGFVVIWTDAQATATSQDVKGQRFDAGGAPLGGEFQVNTYTTGQQRYPSVGMADDGSFVVVWTSHEQEAGGIEEVYAQRYSSGGAPLGGELRVNSFTTGSQIFGDVAVAPAGDFVVVWQDYRAGTPDVFARRFAATGTPLGSEFRVNAATTFSHFVPRVGKGRRGEFVVAWTSIGQDGDGDGVFAQRFGRAGSPLGGEFRVNTYTTSTQSASDVKLDAQGRLVVVFDSYGADGSRFGVYRRRLAALVPGDANGDGVVNVNDIFFLINSLFAGGASPVGEADVNADGAVNVSDVFYLINFLFAGGAPPL